MAIKTLQTRTICCLLSLLLLPCWGLAEIGVILTDEDGNISIEAPAGLPELMEELEELAESLGPVAAAAPAAGLQVLMAAAAPLTPPAYPGSLVREGQSGINVTIVQARLKELGYFTGTVTGKYEPSTTSGVKTFQTKNGLAPDGVVGPMTWAKLFFDAFVIPADLPPPYPGNYVKSGQSNVNVRLVQARLKDLGYFSGSVSGTFDAATLAGVKAFQAKNGLAADGIVGPMTWAKLFFDPDAVPAGALAPPTTGTARYRITVDVVNQVTTVYGKDAQGYYTKVLKRMICSTGTSSYPTPISVYTLNGQKARWCFFPQWNSHAQYWTRISSSIAFHSVIYSRASTDALVLSSYTALGTPASHGCIRLLVSDAKWIYDNCGSGVMVETFAGVRDPEGTQALKPAPIQSSTNLPMPTPQPTAAPVYNPSLPPPYPFRTLTIGSKGTDVFWLQSRLKEIGLYAGSVTGGYYEGTRDAVKAYQRANGLTVDGLAGVLTQTSLYAHVLSPARNTLIEPAMGQLPISATTALPPAAVTTPPR